MHHRPDGETTPPARVRELRDGQEDGLSPLEPLDLDRIGGFADLLAAMRKTAFGGRNLGEAFEVLQAMDRDETCSVVLTLSGAMTVAKMGRVVCKMIDEGMVDCIISTGALMAHGLTEAIGQTHYRHEPGMDDVDLFEKGYNRVYDTLEMEKNLYDVERVVRAALDRMDIRPPERTITSERFCRAVGQILHERDEGPGILRSAYEQDVSVFIPAFTDSEVGLDVATWWMQRERAAGRFDCLDDIKASPCIFDSYEDLYSYARFCQSHERLGIFTIGGGVPRNWAQQVAPFMDLVATRVKIPIRLPRFRYGCRICPDPPYWGGLSGCTYTEGVSWGKFVPREEGGRFAEVYADATLVWPLLVKGVLESRKK